VAFNPFIEARSVRDATQMTVRLSEKCIQVSDMRSRDGQR
jgi:hypothetical protein